MTKLVEIGNLELAAMMCSRVCHDLASPVGAISNGLEFLDEEDDPEMQTQALGLIRQSVAQALASVEFARLAYGAAGSFGPVVPTDQVTSTADGLLSSAKLSLSWQVQQPELSKDFAKLVLNLALMATGAIPRGGSLVIEIGAGDEVQAVMVRASGPSPRVPREVQRLLNSSDGDEEEASADPTTDTRMVQPYYTFALADFLGLDVSVAEEGETIAFRVQSRGGEPAAE